jgi:DNA invertase Pin-like site-specific DNA recombinase
MTSGKPLTPELKAEIERRMVAGGWPSVVAKDLGVSRWAVTNVIKNKGKV